MHRHTSRFALLAVIAAVVGTIAACAPAEPEIRTVEVTKEVVVEKTVEVEVPVEEITVGYSAPHLADVGQVTIQQGLMDGAAEKGWKVITTNSNYDVQKQVNDIENLITLGVSAIVAVPNDSAAIVPGIEAANEAGIPFFTIDRSAFGGEVALTVLSDNYLAGKQAGESMVALLTNKFGEPKGKILHLQGDLGTNVAQLRGQGFDDVIAGYPDIEMFKFDTKWKAEVAASAVEDFLTSDPDIDGLYFHTEGIIPGALVAVEQSKGSLPKVGEEGHIIVVGIDGTPDALDMIRDGEMDMTASQPLYDFGFVISDFVENMLVNGEEIEPGTIEEEGALWSPAEISMGEYGMEALLATTAVSADNVDNPGLWGNVLK
jgi:ABC-type sugar transport system substrate-binding protein